VRSFDYGNISTVEIMFTPKLCEHQGKEPHNLGNWRSFQGGYLRSAEHKKMFCCGRFVGPREDKMPIPIYYAWLRSSVLGQSVDAYVDYLHQQQYRSAVIRIYLRGVAHFARWV